MARVVAACPRRAAKSLRDALGPRLRRLRAHEQSGPERGERDGSSERQRAVGQAPASLGPGLRGQVAPQGTVHGPVTPLDWIIVAFALLMALLGLHAGPDRGRPVAGRVRGRRAGRLAAGPAAARGGVALALRAARRAHGRAAGRRRAGLGARGAGLSPAPPPRGRLWACSTASAGRCSWAAWASGWRGSSARWRCTRRVRATCASRSSARSILRELNAVLPPSGPAAQGAGALRPVPARSTAPTPGVRRAGLGHRPRPGGAGRRRAAW